MSNYQPNTGAKCGCKRGVQRDNCPNCEGTGMVIDFRRIRHEVHTSLRDHGLPFVADFIKKELTS